MLWTAEIINLHKVLTLLLPFLVYTLSFSFFGKKKKKKLILSKNQWQVKQLGFWLNSWKWPSLLLFSSKGFTLLVSFSLNPSLSLSLWLVAKKITYMHQNRFLERKIEHFLYWVIDTYYFDELSDGEFVVERCIWEKEVYECGGSKGSPPSAQRLYTFRCLWSSSFYPKGCFWIYF